ncbi:MAG: Maf family protein, partial [Lentisphaeria bacterium]|nr:Maf family protein [Lentisphaeria bacterium]
MLILASESPRRRELLGKIVEKFEVRSANIEEISAGTDPFYVPEHNARAKAQCVAEEYPEALVIGSDTVIVFEGKVIGKPRDIEDAKNILRSFSGKKHYV